MRLSQFLSSSVNRVLFPDRLLHVIRSAFRREVWALKLLNGMIVSGQERVGREHMCAHVSPTPQQSDRQSLHVCVCVCVCVYMRACLNPKLLPPNLGMSLRTELVCMTLYY